jgi:phosphoglucosamine mutase
MRKLFGTDGVRGVANKDLTVTLSLRLARAAATVLRRLGDNRPTVVIGRDTRISGDMIETAMIAGYCSAGADVIPVGVIPTAGIAYIVRQLDVDMGVVISASHNPFEFNGIKFFSHKGFKLPDEVEENIEEYVESNSTLDHPLGEKLGRIRGEINAGKLYMDYLLGLSPDGLKGLKLAVDCANGAASNWAPKMLRELGAEVIVINDQPNGLNINTNCGATYPQVVGDFAKAIGADAGLSFDGDADRLLMSDEMGNVIDGDFIMAMTARDLLSQGKLAGNMVVGTVMSNLGLERALEKMGCKLIRTQVGDRYVLEEMQKLGAVIGGEQSGHVIYLDHATTGDGLVTALMMCNMLKRDGRKMSELSKVMETFPQKLVNITVKSVKGWQEKTEIAEAVAIAEEDLGSEGRVLVRASGTEPKLRIMIEALCEDKVEKWSNYIAKVAISVLK